MGYRRERSMSIKCATCKETLEAVVAGTKKKKKYDSREAHDWNSQDDSEKLRLVLEGSLTTAKEN